MPSTSESLARSNNAQFNCASSAHSFDLLPNDSAAKMAIAAVPTARFAVLEIDDDSYWG